MNIPLLLANALTLVITLGHTIGGDKELRKIMPNDNEGGKLEIWVHSRAHLFLLSADFLLATIGLGLINFTDFFPDEHLILSILAIYFFAYAVSFFIAVAISKGFSGKFKKLFHWCFHLVIGALIFVGMR